MTSRPDYESMRCDFCGGPKAIYEYPCEDFEAFGPAPPGKSEPVLISRSIGPWAACERCSDFVEVNDFVGLAEEVTASTDHPMPTGDRKDLLIYLWQQFDEKRTTIFRMQRRLDPDE